MFLRNFKLPAVLLTAVFILVYFGAVTCLTLNAHACCPEQNTDCSIIVLSQMPKIAKTAFIQVEVTNPIVAVSPLFLVPSNLCLIVADPPNFVLQTKINHLSTAPPQA